MTKFINEVNCHLGAIGGGLVSGRNLREPLGETMKWVIDSLYIRFGIVHPQNECLHGKSCYHVISSSHSHARFALCSASYSDYNWVGFLRKPANRRGHSDRCLKRWVFFRTHCTQSGFVFLCQSMTIFSFSQLLCSSLFCLRYRSSRAWETGVAAAHICRSQLHKQVTHITTHRTASSMWCGTTLGPWN